MKLVFKHTFCSEPECFEWDVPFEYESKEKFIFDVIKEPSTVAKIGLPWYDYYNDFKFNELPEHIKNIDSYVLTLEEWFDKYAVKL